MRLAPRDSVLPAAVASTLALVLAVPLALAACGVVSDPPAPPPPDRPKSSEGAAMTPVAPPSPEALARFAAGSNAVGLDLYRRLRLAAGNLIVSPASVSMALTMTWGGARGETAEQMRRVLHLEGSATEVMSARMRTRLKPRIHRIRPLVGPSGPSSGGDEASRIARPVRAAAIP